VARAIIFIKKNFSVVIVLFLLLASCVLAAAILYNVVDGTIPKSSLLLIALTFSIQQLLIVFRLIMRMVFFTSELIIFRDLNAEIISPLLTTESEGE
jgi:hypothetical protein